MQGIRVLLICFYSVPAIIGSWWLFLFSRKSVAAQFAGVLGAPAPQKPSPPTPIAILAWLYITSAAHIVLLPFLPFSLPFMLFGHFFFGTVSTVAYILVCLIFVTAGIGMLKLKQWSYSLSIGLQSFFLASTIVTVLNPNYEAQIASWNERLQEAMQLPADLRYNPMYQHHPHWTMYVGPAIPLAVIVMQFYYRRRFLSEANLAAAGAATQANRSGRTENSQSS